MRRFPLASGSWARLAPITMLAFSFFVGSACSVFGRSPAVAAGQLSSDIVFTQLAPARGSSGSAADAARLVRLSPDGTLKVLSQGFFAARDPDISFDGKRILFAGKCLARDYWQVYEMNADGSGVRRVTSERFNCRSPIYQSTLYTITSSKPWYQVSFVGSPKGMPTNLYSAKLDGTTVRRITFNPYGDMDPFLMPDGRILFAGRQAHRLEPGPVERTALFGINLDGTDYAVFSADEGARWKRMPTVTTDRLAVFVEADKREPGGAGRLAAVTLRRNLHSYRKLSDPADGLYYSPAPLPHGKLLVSRRRVDGGGAYGIYRFDPVTGKAVLLYDSPKYDDIQAKRLAPRPVPDGRSSVVNEKASTGIFYCLNVYTTDFRNPHWMPPGTAKRLRVIEGLPRVGRTADGKLLPPAKRMLGEVNVEEDGSFNIRVPANIPIQLQLLDKDGLALRTCSWIWVRNKEPRGCIGCHEDGELTPENRMVMAVTKPSVNLTLPPERRWRVTYQNDVEPILRNKCATKSCHGGRQPPRFTTMDDVRGHLAGAARTSPLVWQLFGRNTSRPWDGTSLTSGKIGRMPPSGSAPLTDAERRTIIEWIDLGAE